MPKLLTKRKEKWVGQFKPKHLRGKPLHVSLSVIGRYDDELRRLVKTMTGITQRKLEQFFKEPHAEEFFALDASVSSQARILVNEMERQFDDLFGLRAKDISEGAVEDVVENSERMLKASLKQLSGGLVIDTDISTGVVGDVVKASVAENVGLIKNIPQQYLTGVRGAVMRSITTGRGLADLVPYLQKHEGITLRRARIIANDQTRKAFNAINKGKMEAMGVNEYEWLHSGGGQTPRPYHLHTLAGKIFSFDNPPIIDPKTKERGIPGQLINCRCTMVPVIKFEDV